MNSTANPVSRGNVVLISATGLGAYDTKGPLDPANAQKLAIMSPSPSSKLNPLQNGTFRCETVDVWALGMVKSDSLGQIERAPAGGPFHVEEKEFLLTPVRQSGMNGFTASGFRAILRSCLARTEDNNYKRHVPRKEASVRSGGRLGGSPEIDSPPDTEKFPKVD
jgi:hypothetical protein